MQSRYPLLNNMYIRNDASNRILFQKHLGKLGVRDFRMLKG